MNLVNVMYAEKPVVTQTVKMSEGLQKVIEQAFAEKDKNKIKTLNRLFFDEAFV